MKHKTNRSFLLRAVLFQLALLVATTVVAHDFEVDGIYYKITDSVASVTFRGQYVYTYVGEYTDTVSIPESVTYNGTTYRVTSIGSSAFSGCSELTSVNIPSSITSIGSSAFYNCSGIINIIIPQSVTYLGSSAFSGCSGLTRFSIPSSVSSVGGSLLENCTALTNVSVYSSLTTIPSNMFKGCTALASFTMPRYLTKIGQSAFSGCTALTSVTLPGTTSEIGESAFRGCSAMTSINLPNNITSIGQYAFYGCSALKSVTIPSCMTAIDDYVFQGCSSMTSLTIPNTITSIGVYSFTGCKSLLSLNIPYSVTNITGYSFIGCSGLKSIVIEEGNRVFDSREGCNALIRTATNTLMLGCENTIIPNTVTTISENAFNGCTGLTEITIPNSVTSIGSNAFANCTGLTDITLSNSLTGIGYCTFIGCSSLTSIVIPESVTSIGEGAFRSCSALADITIPSSVTTIGYGAFDNTAWYMNQPEGLIYAGSIAYVYKGKMPNGTSIVLREGTTCIAGNAFFGDEGLVSISIPNSVTYIGERAFEFCSGLTSIVIPNSVTDIGSYAFHNCSGLTSVTLSNSLTTIGYRVFQECTSLTSIIIPESVISISQNAFMSCTALANIIFPESLESIGYYGLYGTAWERLQPDGLIYAGHVAFKYKGEMPEGTSIVLREGTKGIASRAFYGYNSLVSITLPNTVTNIANYAFEGCYHLTQINFPESLRSISHNAFSGCPLNSLVIPSGITRLGDNTFSSAVPPKVICLATTPPQAYYYTFSSTAYQSSPLYVPKQSLDAYQHSEGWRYFNTIIGFETENYLSVEDMTALHGDTIIIPISMTNIDDITAVQADIFLPDGMELVQEDDEYLIEPSDRLPLNTVLMSNDVSSGGVRVLCYTSNGEPISGNEGDLFYLTVKVAEDAQGDYPITLRNIVLTTPDPLDLTVLDDSAYVHVLSYLLGDANCSKAVTVSDIVTTARYILDMNPEPFDFEAADVNVDNSITASDIVLIMHIIMDKPMMNGPQRQPDMRSNNDRLSGDNIQLKPGETRQVSIVLDNALDYTAFQFDLSLPEGLTASNFSLTDRASAHSLDANMLQNGNTRVLSYSPQLAAIANSEGTLLTFDVTAATTVTGDITACDIEFVTPDGGSVHFAPITIGVNSMTAVDEFTTSKQVTRVDYFDLSGQQLSQPATGVNIIVTTYSDGTRSVAKVNK